MLLSLVLEETEAAELSSDYTQKFTHSKYTFPRCIYKRQKSFLLKASFS